MADPRMERAAQELGVSHPWLNLARKWGMPYGDALLIADYIIHARHPDDDRSAPWVMMGKFSAHDPWGEMMARFTVRPEHERQLISNDVEDIIRLLGFA